MNEVIVTKDNFEAEVLKCDKPVLVDFWASWCNPCRMLSPVIAEIAEERPDLKVCKCNVDENPELAEAYNVMGIPMVLLFKNGKVTANSVGFKQKEDFFSLFNL